MTTAIDILDDLRLDDLPIAGTDRASLLAETDGSRGIYTMRRNTPAYVTGLVETAKLYRKVLQGDRWATLRFQENMSRSDFPLLFGDILDRQLLGGYAETAYTWQAVAHRSVVNDFRTVKKFMVDGGEGLLPDVGENDQYPATYVTESTYSYSVTKRGRRMPFTWEALINDDLQALRDAPMRFGRAARKSEEDFVTRLYCDASGPHASFYTVGNKNIVNATNSGGPWTAINPPLSIAGLQQALVVLAKQIDPVTGEPIDIDAVTLVVPRALEITAQNILNATELRINAEPAGGGTSTTQIITGNWMRGRLRLEVNSRIPSIATTANANTSWWLFASPSTNRPALHIGFLRGHESPELFMKAPNAIRVGGGSVDPISGGDFDTDGHQYKVRHVFGGTRANPVMTVASNGSGA